MIAVAEPEPVLPSPARRGVEGVPRLVRPPPASLRIDKPGERVEQAVEIRRDVETEDLDVVADVSDHRELARVEHGRETTCEAGAASAAREEDDLHAGTARSARVRGPSLAESRSRSVSESTSSSSSGIETVANDASSRNRRALPGP